MAVTEKRVSKDGKSISYRAKVRVRGYPPQSATFERKSDADKWAQRVEAEMKDDKYFPNTKARKHTVSELIDAYLKDLHGKNRRRHDEVKPMLEWWKAEVGHKTLSHFMSEDILNGQQALLARKKTRKSPEGKYDTLSPSTVNRYTFALQTAINFGIRPLKWIANNPLDELDKLGEPPGRVRFLSNDEIDRLLAACKASKNPYLFAIVLIGLSTGARRKEIQWMRWQDVNEDASLVILPKTKTKVIRSAHLTGIASELVKKMRENKQEGQIFLFPSPNNPNRPIDFESAWRHALKESGIKDFRFHDQRHTCASYLAMDGANTLAIAEALGHKTLQMVKRYAHLCKSHTSDVVGQMTGKVLGHVEI